MIDRIEQIAKSRLQHGKLNDRVYIMSLAKEDFEDVVKRAEELCRKEKYGKIFAKVPKSLCRNLVDRGYKREAGIPGFYKGSEDCVFLARFFSRERERSDRQEERNTILTLAASKKCLNEEIKLDDCFRLESLTEDEAPKMSDLYKAVFSSYPFPVFDPDYLIQTMRDNVEYAGVWYKDRLVSIASAEKSPYYSNAEMTDFATLSDYSGNNFSVALLKFLEEKMIDQRYKTLYSIARSLSAAMNITFRKCGYTYSGTLINNTNICGSIESMNIWHKSL